MSTKMDDTEGTQQFGKSNGDTDLEEAPGPSSASVLATLFPDGERNRARRVHAFITKELIASVPRLHATEQTPAVEITLHIHYSVLARDWYVAELDPETGDAYVLTIPGPSSYEWGYMNLRELEEDDYDPFVVHRDIHFRPTMARELGMPAQPRCFSVRTL